MHRKRFSTVAVPGFFLLFAGIASAQTATDQFVVSITVENDCTVQVDDLNFGTVVDLTPEIDADTTGTVSCTGIAPVSVSLDAGTGGASTFATRQMEGPDTIDYNLYRDPARTEILGDGSAGTFTIDFTSTGGADPFEIYGRTESGQNPKPEGTYDSTITATVTF